MRQLSAIVLIALCLRLSVYATETYDEELILIPHGDSVVAHFNFVTEITSSKASLEGLREFELVAKQLAAAIAEHNVFEMHLSLTRGEWRESLGYPITSSPTGAELWAWFGNETDVDAGEKWKRLLHVLSSMYCTSLLQLTEEAVSTRLAYKPTGFVPRDIAKQPLKYMRYGAIARETLCTENLAPSKNILPCSGNVGLASLLNPIKLFDTEFNALQLHVRHVVKPVGNDGAGRQLVVEVRQSFTAVFELFNAVQPPDSISFTLKSLFDKVVMERCNAARRSTILVDVTNFRSNATSLDRAEFSPAPSFISETKFTTAASSSRTFAAFELHGDAFVPSRDPFFNLVVTLRPSKDKAAASNRFFAKRAVPLGTHRFLTGYGQDRNGVKTYLRNFLKTEALTVTYFESIPWFARIAFNSIRVEIQRSSDNDSAPFEHYAVDTLHVLPGVDRERPHQFELLCRIPAKATVSISYEFEKAALRFYEYPPDPNHGFYLPASTVSFSMSNGVVGSTGSFATDKYIDAHFYNQIHSNYSTLTGQLLKVAGAATNSDSAADPSVNRPVFQRVHTHILNFAVATPDFSMPFNVICLTSTVVAIAFGSLHSLTTRTFVLVDGSKRKTLKDRLLGFFKRSGSEKQKAE